MYPIGLFGGRGEEYSIDQSALFDSANSSYLSRTFTSSATWTLSVWVKRATISSIMGILEGGLQFNTANTITAVGLTTTEVFRDVAEWYHVCVSNNGLEVNGVNLGSVTTSALTNPDIGRTGTSYFSGYLSELHFIDGQSISSSSFGRTDVNGRWVPKAYTGAYGTHGFYLSFNDNTSFGKDSSGNGNDFTNNGFTVDHQVSDTPTNNYATLNTIGGSTVDTITDGALKVTGTTNASFGMHPSTVPMTSGKWVMEVVVNTVPGTPSPNSCFIGVGSYVVKVDGSNQTYVNSGVTAANLDVGATYIDGATQDTGLAGNANGNRYRVEFDADAQTVTFFRNNTAFGTANLSVTDIGTGQFYFYVSGRHQTSLSASVMTANFGQRSFIDTPTSGFNNLHSKDLKVLTGPYNIYTSCATEDDYSEGTYTGNGNADGPFVYLGYKPTYVCINGTAYTDGSTLIDILSNGFKVRSTSSSVNTNSTSYTWEAWVDQDFKYGRAITNG